MARICHYGDEGLDLAMCIMLSAVGCVRCGRVLFVFVKERKISWRCVTLDGEEGSTR